SKGWALTGQKVLFTSDSGQNWKDVTPSASGKIGQGTFMDDKNAWISSVGANGVNLMHTNDLSIGSAQNAWATDQNGNVFGTSYAGENWSKLASNVDKIKALSFVDTSNGWAISKTKLWHTTDGGSHWSQITYHIGA